MWNAQSGANSPPATLANPSWSGVASRLTALISAPDAPLVAVCVWLLGLSWFLRLHALDYPEFLLFDEHHFITNARNYLARAADANDHPPLGKLWIALSMHYIGDEAYAWRLPSAVFGALTVGLGTLTARRLFDDRRAALLAATFLSVDGFLSAYSRTACLDGALGTMAVVSVLSTTLPELPLAVVGGVGAGLALSTKFSGIAALVPPLLALSFRVQNRGRALSLGALCGGVAVGVYFLCYLIGLSLSGADATLGNVFSETRRLFAHHAELTDMRNPQASAWYTWILPVRTFVLGKASEGGMVRALSALGNLVLWWSACVVGIASGIVVAWRGVGQFIQASASPKAAEGESLGATFMAFLSAQPRAVLLLLAGALAFLAPWVLTHRDSYIYHFLPTYTLLLILLAGFASALDVGKGHRAVTFTVLVAIFAGIYAPLYAFIPISEAGFDWRIPFESWR